MSTETTRERVFAFMRDRLLQGEPPSVREVQEALGFKAVQSAQEHLEALVEEGRLIKGEGRSRSYRLAGKQRHPWRVPLLGRVQAGNLTEAVEEREGYVLFESRDGFRDQDALFALRVRGESMVGAGIFENDVVIVRKQPTAQSGDIVVALVGEEATVKRLRINNKRQTNPIELWPENPAFEPIIPTKNEPLQLLGKVLEVRRYFEVF